MKKKKCPIPNTLLVLLVILTVVLALFIIYLSFPNILKSFRNIKEYKDITSIEKENIKINDLQYDTDLSKFPSDYKNITETLDISLTQHEKTALLLYGQTIHKAELENITEAYQYLIDKNIPILIPQKYINEYFNEAVEEYIDLLPEKIENFEDDITYEKEEFNNKYEKYIFDQITDTLNDKDTKNIDIYPKASDFILDLNNDNINEEYKKIKTLETILPQYNSNRLFITINSILSYTKDQENTEIKEILSTNLKNIIFNRNLNKDAELYWAISIIEDKSYVYPIYISEEFKIDDNNFDTNYDVEPKEQSSGTVRIPILMYHHISDMPSNGSKFVQGLYVTPDVFEQQLAYLVKHNYKTITPKDLYYQLQKGQNPKQKSVMITFDDGTLGQYTNAYPLLKKYGLRGVYYIPSSKSAISYTHLKEMANNGMVIGSHSSTHLDLTKTDDPDILYKEIVGSRYALRNATGQDIISICYPGCVADSQVFSYVSQAGYLLGMSCGRGIDHRFSSRLSLSRVHVFNNLDDFKQILSGYR